MRSRSVLSRLALWSAVVALLLRAGMPLLAVAAAQFRGVPVGAVCEVYGVALPDMAAQSMPGHAHHHHHQAGQSPHHAEPDSDHGSDHDSDHCALTALGSLGTPAVALPAAEVGPGSAVTSPTVAIEGPRYDPLAAWAARLGHGPPVRA